MDSFPAPACPFCGNADGLQTLEHDNELSCPKCDALLRLSMAGEDVFGDVLFSMTIDQAEAFEVRQGVLADILTDYHQDSATGDRVYIYGLRRKSTS